jgi:cyclopropane fatty-acyl-phospholipid synthase-like methyltransferase
VNTDALARWYRWVEYLAFGRTLERSRREYASRLANAAKVLVLGEGDGRALQAMLQAAPNCHFDVVEQSPRMVALARQRIGANITRVRFLQTDARTAALTGPYDAAVANYFFDCLEPVDIARLLARVAAHMRPDALWLCAEFEIPPTGWRRLHAQLWVHTMYWFFRLTTGLRVRRLPHVQSLMRHAGWQCVASTTWRFGLIRASLWQRAPR